VPQGLADPLHRRAQELRPPGSLLANEELERRGERVGGNGRRIPAITRLPMRKGAGRVLEPTHHIGPTTKPPKCPDRIDEGKAAAAPIPVRNRVGMVQRKWLAPRSRRSARRLRRSSPGMNEPEATKRTIPNTGKKAGDCEIVDLLAAPSTCQAQMIMAIEAKR